MHLLKFTMFERWATMTRHKLFLEPPDYSIDRNTFWLGVSCHGSNKSLHVCMFYSDLNLSHRFFFSLLLFLLLGTEYRNQSCVPSPARKTKPCSYNCVICFPSMIESSLLSGPTNKHKFRREKREEGKKSVFYIAILNYSHFLASLLSFLFTFPYFLSLCTPTLYSLDTKHDTLNDGGFASSVSSNANFIFFFTVREITIMGQY